MIRETLMVIGESTALGFNSLVPPQVYNNQSRIFSMTNAALDITPATDPIVAGGNFGVSPAIGFGDEYLNLRLATDQVCLIVGAGIGLINDVWSDTSLSYTVSINAAKHAEAVWGPIAGFLVLKGINDATDIGITQYPTAIRRFIAKFRADLKRMIPFVVCGMPPNVDFNPDRDVIQSFINQLPNDTEKLATIAGHDLPVNSNTDVHWTAPSSVTIGNRAATALVSL